MTFFTNCAHQAHVHGVGTALGALLCAGLSGQAAAAPAVLINQATNTCLTVRDGRTSNSVDVQLAACANALPQLWDLTGAGEARVYGHHCLDLSGWGNAAGTVVQSYVCNGFANQAWTLRADGSLLNRHSGLCLAMSTVNTGIVSACNGTAAQSWRRGVAQAGAPADTSGPTPPGGLVVSSLSCSSATLSWTASSDPAGIASYDIYHDGQRMLTVPGAQRSARLTLTPSVNWGLYVTARDGAGNVSQASATTRVAVPACSVDSQAPGTPTGLSGTVSGTAATLNWARSTDNVGVRAYQVFRNGVQIATTPNISFTDSGLAPSTSFNYFVRATDVAGNVSQASTSVTLRSGAACASALCAVTQVGTETGMPWGLIALPDGRVLYSRRDELDLVVLNPATGAKTLAGSIPNATGTNGEGGAMGLAALPGFPVADPWLYVMHSTATDNRVVRMRFANGRVDTASLQVLLSGIARNNWHNGGRLRFGPDGKLYIAAGDAQNGSLAQSTASLNGKVLRINQDGAIPSDNPFGNAVWSYGHRNPQGLAFDAQGRLWEQEFGEGRMDETNLIVRGGNYGWPQCEGTAGTCNVAGFIAPKRTYLVADGSCSGISIVREKLYVACQRGARLYRMDVSGSSLINQQQLLVGTHGPTAHRRAQPRWQSVAGDHQQRQQRQAPEAAAGQLIA